MDRLSRWLNDARIRSAVAGGLGGFLGWCAAELFVGRPAGLGTAALAGLLCGVGIAGTLSAAEGAVIRSWSLARRGLLAGIALGAVGGTIGAAFGQLTYSLTSSQGTIFSPDVESRIAQGGGERGEIEVALIWENTNDLDLHVFDPSGEEIDYLHKTSRSGGWLDIDRNAACSDTINTPIEHVRWRQGSAPEGTYRVAVVCFANCGNAEPTKYRVAVKRGNEPIEEHPGTISFTNKDDRHPVCEFKWPPPARSMGFFGILAIIIGWGIFGALVGVAEGSAKRSSTALRNAGIGGTIGGTLGGIALVAILGLLAAGSTTAAHSLGAHSGWFGRLIGFIILGACVGLWIVLIERALSAILAVRSGRHEGREIFLDKPEMRLGRNDALEVFLGGDPAIAAHHATIRREGGSHVLLAVGGQVLVNGGNVTRHSLNNGDTVVLGNTRLIYRHKAAAAASDGQPAGGAVVSRSPAPAAAPVPPPRKKADAAGPAQTDLPPAAPKTEPASPPKSTTPPVPSSPQAAQGSLPPPLPPPRKK